MSILDDIDKMFERIESLPDKNFKPDIKAYINDNGVIRPMVLNDFENIENKNEQTKMDLLNMVKQCIKMVD